MALNNVPVEIARHRALFTTILDPVVEHLEEPVSHNDTSLGIVNYAQPIVAASVSENIKCC
jgi:hypothetical protein